MWHRFHGAWFHTLPYKQSLNSSSFNFLEWNLIFAVYSPLISFPWWDSWCSRKPSLLGWTSELPSHLNSFLIFMEFSVLWNTAQCENAWYFPSHLYSRDSTWPGLLQSDAPYQTSKQKLLHGERRTTVYVLLTMTVMEAATWLPEARVTAVLRQVKYPVSGM